MKISLENIFHCTSFLWMYHPRLLWIIAASQNLTFQVAALIQKR
nr:MAG TPA: hypothetical protein [Caudoviricetes sp.]